MKPSYHFRMRMFFFFLENNVFVGEMCVSIPDQEQERLWRCWLKGKKNIIIHSKTHLFPKGTENPLRKEDAYILKITWKARLQFVNVFGDKYHNFWRHVLWCHENQLLFRHISTFTFKEKGEILIAILRKPFCY